MSVIQIPTNIIEERLSRLEFKEKEAHSILQKFKKTKELGFLFDLTRITRDFYSNEYYLLRTELNSVQKKRLELLFEKVESIEYYINIEINKLSGCKV